MKPPCDSSLHELRCVDVPVLLILEERVEAFPQECLSERVGDQIVEVPMPQNVEERPQT